MPRLLFILLSPFFLINYMHATEWHVGPTRTYTTPSAVSALMNHGDTISIDAAIYVNHPQVYFTKNNLLIRGVGGRPRLEAGQALANNTNGKAIFVLSGSDVVVENIEFADAAVPDHNGAGIRQEGCDLTVRHCFFTGNEMGILGGSYTDCKVVLEHNVFTNNGSTANPGYQHNVYINTIDTLIFRFNYSVDAIAEGHELKSRARNNIILYNYIGNQTTEDSRTIDLPNGGMAILLGNIIEQGPNSANSNLVGYGLEGFYNPGPHNVWAVNNTFVNKKTTGSFIHTAFGTDTLYMKNNIIAGAFTAGIIGGVFPPYIVLEGYIEPDLDAVGFVDASAYNYKLMPNSVAIDIGHPVPQTVAGYALVPVYEYADTASYIDRNVWYQIDAGAYEYQYEVVSTQPPAKDAGLSVYPNPCLDRLFVKNLPENTPFRVFDLNGKYVMGGIVMFGNIPLDGVPSGNYVLQIAGEAFMFAKM